ncbi:MAG TPA: hypothetical protein VGI26_11400 [Solirubrobacteraceae bacterium]|jgi:hypothetical protein
MARVAAYIPDLLFGSQVQGSLRAAGHDVDLIGDERRVAGALAEVAILVVDLTDDCARRAGLFESLPREVLSGVHTLAFYSHVDVEARRVAEQAGFDLVVPRSRMAREGAELVTQLAGEPPQ